MNPFVSRITSHSWEIPVGVLSLVLGVMISLAWITETNRPSRIQQLGVAQSARIEDGRQPQQSQAGDIDIQKLQTEISKLRNENGKLQNAMASSSSLTRVLNEQLQNAKLIAGLTEVEGPGVTVTLRDSTKDNVVPIDRIIHDTDVLKVVNELWACGAEAITVNGHRVVGGTSFRCVGPVIHVEGVPIASPVVIRAIGDSDTLIGGLDIPNGVLDEIRREDPAMVQVEKASKHHFAAYTGPTNRNYLSVPKESK